MWFNFNGHHAKSNHHECEVFHEPKTNRQNYTKEFKNDAAKFFIEQDYSSNEVDWRLGIN